MKYLPALLTGFLAFHTATAQIRPDLVRINGGVFLMGVDKKEITSIAQKFGIGDHPDMIASEAPAHKVKLRTFRIQKYEVTNSQFASFLSKHPEWRPEHIDRKLDNGNYLKNWLNGSFPAGKGDFPIVNVNWYAAFAYCSANGMRLPTEAEWEFAARGGLAVPIFPWGDEPADATRANYAASGLGSAAKVGSYPANGFGLHDMAGNVWEFVADEWRPYPQESQQDPLAGGPVTRANYKNVSSRRVIRGGSFGGVPLNMRVSYRDSHPANGSREFVGFRCAK